MLTTRLQLMRVAGAAVVILNLVDALFTIVYTSSGVAVESNPLMSGLLGSSPLLFMIAKLGLVSLGVLLLWRLRDRRAAAYGLLATGTAYVTLIAYHLSAVDRLTLIAAS
ncbi:MAG: hypothetical protein H6Q90_5251 [Deltaproteobacteria bacterium]|nr:hypothetical protein [Deltaproteobacteria bacterium]